MEKPAALTNAIYNDDTDVLSVAYLKTKQKSLNEIKSSGKHHCDHV